MILKALYDYYNRDSQSIPFGLKETLISFVIDISQNGEFIRVEDYRSENGKGKPVFVPTGEHNNGESPLLFYDNVQYLLDYVETSDKKKLETSHNKHLSFVNRCKTVAEKSNDDDLKAVSLFYEKGELNKVHDDILWGVITKNTSAWIAFRIDGHPEFVSSKQILLDFNKRGENDNHICLVTGNKGQVVRLCASTPIAGSKNSAKLVSFNDDSFCSYGKSQCENATISNEAEFAFSSAFKKLTRYDDNNHNKFYIGNRTFVFWVSSNDDVSAEAEESIFSLFNISKEEADDPNRRIDSVRKVFNDIYSGIRPTSDDDRFYFLGLAPNAARIAVVYWHECKLKDFAGTILRHFKDTDIVDTRKENKPYQGLYQILSAVTLGGKYSDAQPNLPEAVVKSIMQGLPYPASLFQACIRRIRAEQQLTITRAAIIKAYLNRLNDNNKKIEIMLDKENTNVGYLCGRLFATLEKIQEDANHIHTIRERYLNSASATPAAVFATIMNLSVHHSEKLNAGHQIFFEKVKQEIISKLPADGFPPHLELQDQGRFFVGYYHQRQDFFTSKEANDAGVNEETQNEE